jgi:hypothetical protein
MQALAQKLEAGRPPQDNGFPHAPGLLTTRSAVAAVTTPPMDPPKPASRHTGQPPARPSAHADAHRPSAHRHRSGPHAPLSSLMVPFAHCEDTFPPAQTEYPEWAGYDQIDERGFCDAA